MAEKHGGPAASALYRTTTALLPHLRVWDGTKIIEPRSAPAIRHAVHEYSILHTIADVRVLVEPCKPKAHFTITQVPRTDARSNYDNAVEWTAGGGEVALLTELAWLSDATYPLAPSDVYVVPQSTWLWATTKPEEKIAMAWFVFGRKREGRWWLL